MLLAGARSAYPETLDTRSRKPNEKPATITKMFSDRSNAYALTGHCTETRLSMCGALDSLRSITQLYVLTQSNQKTVCVAIRYGTTDCSIPKAYSVPSPPFREHAPELHSKFSSASHGCASSADCADSIHACVTRVPLRSTIPQLAQCCPNGPNNLAPYNSRRDTRKRGSPNYFHLEQNRIEWVPRV